MKEYNKYEDFTSEFVREAMANGYAIAIVNWQDALGVCQLLNTFTIDGKSVAMKCEFADLAYADVQEQKSCDGNMMITLFNSAEMICEKCLDDVSAYVGDASYYVEESAGNVPLPSTAKVIPFKLKTEIFENVF